MVLACLLLLAGCGRTVFVSGGGYAPSSQPGHAVSGQPLSEQADAAWKAGNYAEAERLYNVVARDAALPTDQRALAWESVAREALSSGNMQGAQNALKFWNDMVTGAEQAFRCGRRRAAVVQFRVCGLGLASERSVRAVRQQDRRGCHGRAG